MFTRKPYDMKELIALAKTKEQPNQLHLEILSVSGLNPFVGNDSSSRAQMMGSHLAQMLVISKPTKRKVQTGAEREFGKYTYNVKMPCNGTVLHVVDRFEKSLGKDSIEENPEQVIIYEDDETKEIGCISLKAYCTHSDYFGFAYKKGKHQNMVRANARIPKDAVFLESPNIDDDGDYNYGAELNVAFMTHPATSEDSILICTDVVDRFSYRVYDSIMVEWGRTSFALNLYGDDDHYKPFPDIGETIREDGLLMTVRENKIPQEERNKRVNILAPIETSVAGCQEVDYVFDKTLYMGGPGGRIVDIKVHHDTRTKEYTAMDQQALKYDSANKLFSQRLVTIYHKLKARHRDGLTLTPAFHKMIVEALSVCSPEKGAERITKIFKQDPIDRYMVEFVVEYIQKPNLGSKFTDLHGGKGVVCQFEPPENMPVDCEGNRADLVADPNGTMNRMNLGRSYEQYYTASANKAHKVICGVLGIAPFTHKGRAIAHMQSLPDQVMDMAWQSLVEYHGIINPTMLEWFLNGKIGQDRFDFLGTVVESGVYIYSPPDNQKEVMDVVKEMEASAFRPPFGPVTYVGNSGKRVTTKKNIRIGSLYIIQLNKTGHDWNAASTSKLHHYGVPAVINKPDKNTKPSRKQPTRGCGESEMRNIAAYCGGEFSAEIMDRNNSPQIHELIARQIIESKTPSNIDRIVDREKYPLGTMRPVQIVKHICRSGGFEFAYKDFTVDYAQPVLANGNNHNRRQGDQ